MEDIEDAFDGRGVNGSSSILVSEIWNAKEGSMCEERSDDGDNGGNGGMMVNVSRFLTTDDPHAAERAEDVEIGRQHPKSEALEAKYMIYIFLAQICLDLAIKWRLRFCYCRGVALATVRIIRGGLAIVFNQALQEGCEFNSLRSRIKN